MTRNAWMRTTDTTRLNRYVSVEQPKVELVLAMVILAVHSSARVLMADFIRYTFKIKILFCFKFI